MKEQLRSLLSQVWQRKVSLIAYSLIFAGLIWSMLEYINVLNLVSIDVPYEASDFAQIAGAVGSLVLTFGLVILYEKQARIQENQEELMEQDFQPYLTGEVVPLNIVSAQFRIRNSGNANAYNVTAKWEVAGEERSWEVPSIPPDQEYGFPVVVDENENWLLNTSEITKYLEQNNASTTISYDIKCADRFENELTFPGRVDFEVLAKRSEASEIWNTDPVEEISSEVKKLRKDIKKITRVERRRNRESKWKNKSRQISLLEETIEKRGELGVDEINSLTGIPAPTLKYRLEALSEVGALEYNERRGIVKPVSRAGANRTLDEFIR